MKPFHLVKPQRLPVFPQSLIADAADLDRGEIGVKKVSPDKFQFDSFIDHLASCGWKPRSAHLYAEYSLTYCNDSVPWHSDPGFGRVAACLLYRDPCLYLDTQLITKHGPCTMQLGDLIIFDSNHGHAWIGYGPSIFAMVTVSPIRTKL